MKYFGVWFHGNSQEPAQIAYDGREPAIYTSASQAKRNMKEPQEWFPEEKYSIFEFEIKE